MKCVHQPVDNFYHSQLTLTILFQSWTLSFFQPDSWSFQIAFWSLNLFFKSLICFILVNLENLHTLGILNNLFLQGIPSKIKFVVVELFSFAENNIWSLLRRKLGNCTAPTCHLSFSKHHSPSHYKCINNKCINNRCINNICIVHSDVVDSCCILRWMAQSQIQKTTDAKVLCCQDGSSILKTSLFLTA